jgi:hypothetical protein
MLTIILRYKKRAYQLELKMCFTFTSNFYPVQILRDYNLATALKDKETLNERIYCF